MSQAFTVIGVLVGLVLVVVSVFYMNRITKKVLEESMQGPSADVVQRLESNNASRLLAIISLRDDQGLTPIEESGVVTPLPEEAGEAVDLEQGQGRAGQEADVELAAAGRQDASATASTGERLAAGPVAPSGAAMESEITPLLSNAAASSISTAPADQVTRRANVSTASAGAGSRMASSRGASEARGGVSSQGLISREKSGAGHSPTGE